MESLHYHNSPRHCVAHMTEEYMILRYLIARSLSVCLLLALFSGLVFGQSSVPQTFDGYLYAKLTAQGTRSEGPVYYLQLPSNRELTVVKQCEPWKNDTLLHKCLGMKVTIRGSRKADSISYVSIVPIGSEPPPNPTMVIEGRFYGICVDSAIVDALKRAPPSPGPDMIQKFRVHDIHVQIGGIVGRPVTTVKIELLKP
jgi:hypothetical protein